MVHDPVVALETLLSLGFQRVLTSGCDTSALEGLPLIKRLIDQVCLKYSCACLTVSIRRRWCYLSFIPTLSLSQQAKGRIVIMPGVYLSFFFVFISCMDSLLLTHAVLFYFFVFF